MSNIKKTLDGVITGSDDFEGIVKPPSFSGLRSQPIFRKISKKEFDRLKHLFPSKEEAWNKYRDMRLNQFDDDEIDIFVIEYHDEFIGELTVNYVSHELETETIPYVRVYFEAFRLKKEYQGNGFGQQLVKYAIDSLEKDGYTVFTIGVEDDNAVAKHIYSKFGFTAEVDKGYGNEFDSCEYTLYLKDLKKEKTFKR